MEAIDGGMEKGEMEMNRPAGGPEGGEEVAFGGGSVHDFWALSGLQYIHVFIVSGLLLYFVILPKLYQNNQVDKILVGGHHNSGTKCSRCGEVPPGPFSEHNKVCSRALVGEASPPKCSRCGEVPTGPFSEHNKFCTRVLVTPPPQPLAEPNRGPGGNPPPAGPPKCGRCGEALTGPFSEHNKVCTRALVRQPTPPPYPVHDEDEDDGVVVDDKKEDVDIADTVSPEEVVVWKVAAQPEEATSEEDQQA